MSAIFDFGTDSLPNGAIRLKTIEWHIRDAVYQLEKLNVPKPYTVRLTQTQLTCLRMECADLKWVESAEDMKWEIYGCKIEIIERS